MVVISALSITFSLIVTTCSIRESQDSGQKNKFRLLSVKQYEDAVYASWIGQIIGNTYGLGYEFKFIDEPGPDMFPYGYSFTLQDLKKHNGAYSDDDTDIEYMYLIQMENNGIEPTYKQLAEAWKKHVKERVWFANRMAVNLMHAGHFPPVTGSIGFNSEWFQIDPQLVNEIWAVTSPGMLDYAVDKSEFAARITSDSFGLEPTLHYAAMYSSAFFEKDVNKLIDIGLEQLPKDSRFVKIVEHVKSLYRQYPNDWENAREIVKQNYFIIDDYNRHSWAAVDANLNGALGIMALLYGQGDFQKTLDYSCAFGMDADNQAATMCGLLGIVNGFDSIPNGLMFPFENIEWEKPFNDSYKMITREGLEDASITNLAERTVAQGEKIILANGGEIIEKEGELYYRINTNAEFLAPFELNLPSMFFLEVNQHFSYPIFTGGKPTSITLSVEGELPPGIELKGNKLSGIPLKHGEYHLIILASNREEEKSTRVNFKVHPKNLAMSASEILFNKSSVNRKIDIIRDGFVEETYLSVKKKDEREIDFYGYKWNDEQEISSLYFNNGHPDEYGGWFTSFDVEFLKDSRWLKVNDIKITPEMNLHNSQWLKPHFMDYDISFRPLKSKGIRIIGLSGGIPKDVANGHLGIQYYTSISELRVYSE
jgi:ADP-ribosylglycohydrolase